MRNYELLFILDPAMDEAARNQMIETVKGIINADGEAGEADLWGARSSLTRSTRRRTVSTC